MISDFYTFLVKIHGHGGHKRYFSWISWFPDVFILIPWRNFLIPWRNPLIPWRNLLIPWHISPDSLMNLLKSSYFTIYLISGPSLLSADDGLYCIPEWGATERDISSLGVMECVAGGGQKFFRRHCLSPWTPGVQVHGALGPRGI